MANMVKTYLRVEPAPKLFLAKVMGSRSEVRGKRRRRVLRTIIGKHGSDLHDLLRQQSEI